MKYISRFKQKLNINNYRTCLAARILYHPISVKNVREIHIDTSRIDPRHEPLILAPNQHGLSIASKLLEDGKLVAFPTETVYGLGASALNEVAVRSVFEVKERPLTDPLIVHVLNESDAACLLDVTDHEFNLFLALGKRFWPGPLTIIARASRNVPRVVTANTGAVGIRIPSHPIARALLATSKLPIAAPSANLFGHVSPTKCGHVLADLGDKGVHVLHGELGIGEMNKCPAVSEQSCEYGIESTVIKIDGEAASVTLLRQGCIGASQIQEVIDSVYHRATGPRWKLRAAPPRMKENEASRLLCLRLTESENQVVPGVGDAAPGQALTHYAPILPCYIVAQDASWAIGRAQEYIGPDHLRHLNHQAMASMVLLDFTGQLAAFQDLVLAYRDLSVSGSFKEAAKCVFDSLRWAELYPGANGVLLPDLKPFLGADAHPWDKADAHISHGLVDRLHRASSGRIAVMPSK